MQLHRTTGRPDWADIKPADYNGWQRLAARTNSIVTPGNIITMVGFILVLAGLVELAGKHYWAGIILLAIGRLADVADGMVAQATGTKSPLGEKLDVTIDKAGTFLTIITLFVFQLAPWGILLVIILPQLIIPFATLIAFRMKRRVHPAASGKISMALSWVSLVGLLLIDAWQLHRDLFVGVVYAVAFLSAILGLYTAAKYIWSSDG